MCRALKAFFLSLAVVLSLSGASWFFVPAANNCVFPPSVSPLVRFRADQYTGSGSSLELTKLGSLASNATVPGGVSAPTIVNGAGPNGTPVVRFTISPVTYMTFGNGTEIINGTATHDVWLISKFASTVGAELYQCLVTYCVDDGSPAKAQTLFASSDPAYDPFNWGGGNGTAPNPVNTVGIAGFDYSSAFFSLLIRKVTTADYTQASAFEAYKNAVAQTESTNTGGTNSTTCFNLLGAYFPPGTTLPSNADFSELIITNALGSSDRAAVDSYIGCRYSL